MMIQNDKKVLRRKETREGKMTTANKKKIAGEEGKEEKTS